MAREIKLPLTKQQENTLYFILNFIDENGYPPTIIEIKDKLGFNNPGYVHKLLHYLEKKGYIVREKGRHRGIRLTEISETMPTSEQLDLFKV